jgi:DNA-binding MarR family transcriptional regulator
MAGVETAGTETAGAKTAGTETAGTEITSMGTAGAETAGTEITSMETAGAKTAGAEITSMGTAGAETLDAGGLGAELFDVISAIRRIARRAVRQAWHDEPLPPAQSELLRLAAARPGISVADAAHELRLAPNTVSTLVGRLVAEGLLRRARAASDGRSVRLSVTSKARRRIAEWRDLRAELAARTLDRMPASDKKALADAIPALVRFAALLGEEDA